MILQMIWQKSDHRLPTKTFSKKLFRNHHSWIWTSRCIRLNSKWYLLVSSTHSFSFCINGSLGRWIWVNRPWPRRLLLLYWLLLFITPAQWSKIKNFIRIFSGKTKTIFAVYMVCRLKSNVGSDTFGNPIIQQVFQN